MDFRNLLEKIKSLLNRREFIVVAVCLLLIAIFCTGYVFWPQKTIVFEDEYQLNGNILSYRDWDGGATTTIKIRDPKTLTYIGDGYFKDKNSVYSTTAYYYQKDSKNSPTRIKGIVPDMDPETFTIYYSPKEIPPKGGSYYIRENDKISVIINFYETFKHPLPEADTKTFELIKWPYAKDKNKVFYQAEVVVGADPNTFQPVSNYSYFRDKTGIYFEGKKVENANPNEFYEKKFPGSSLLFGLDKTNVYFENQKLIGINPSTMTLNEKAIVSSEGVSWYLSGHCGDIWYIPESQVPDPENYRGPC
ncbi:MAG: hypothetical protein A2571_01865 [Candidatus Vogelbacteria bacterium RIFOXYD1_FULL_44_32]|uniref:Uncharacterized protein n=1 Tax=Candidatus Vogelbacteria bacterium RIFOXYD1_FULL_44_32 TaxID=1802438 RepID=A0A1G2QES9_9BACT|nr:MAG: hypothetical protein A2571_01865 [Candidatus Vogelbacteria bacterium RIFOXYD1_FULL_44_32]